MQNKEILTQLKLILQKKPDLKDEFTTLETMIQELGRENEYLRSELDRYRSYEENALVGVFQSTIDDQYIRVNTAFARMFGYSSPEEMLREVKDIKEIYVDPSQRLLLKDLLFQKGAVDNFECEVYKKNKEKFWIAIYARLITDSEGRSIIECTNLDITESKSLREQLLSSQKMDAIGKLAGGIAHDFNNLLTVILGYSEDFLDELSDEDPLYEPAQEIVKAGMKAANLTRQLLAFSRNQLIHNQLLDCNSIINNLKDIILRLAGENTTLKLFLAEDLKSVIADPGQMEQMLVNIILNARESMPTGGEITISTQNLKIESGYAHQHGGIQPGDYVQISISDTGTGIKKELQEKVFEPFFTTKTDSKGLGLSTSWGIVKQFNGHINLYSEIGQGTRINILIPVYSGADITPKTSSDIDDNEKRYIMVVENEASLCQLLNRMLTNMGYKVQTFLKATQALQKIKNGEIPDLLLSDVVMPEMDGKQLVEEVSKIHPEVKILLMSGFNDDIIIKHGVTENSIPLIQKPFTAREVAPIIHDILAENSHKGKLLILDDDIPIAKILQRSCRKHGFSADYSSDLQNTLTMLKNNDYDLLLVDMNLGEMQGKDVLKIIRNAGFDQPAILLSGMIRDDEDKVLDSLKVVGVMEKSFDQKPLMELIRRNLP
nr:two-component system, cell cycle sensor histidine kinase and response regulator CckA [Candidatus Cloacimonadota bacterium]